MTRALPPTRVLHIGKYYPPERGGIETALQAIAKGLMDYGGIDVECVVANTTSKEVRETYEGVKLRRLKRLTTFSSTPICLGLSQAINEIKPDLIHVHLPNPMVTVQLAKLEIPYVVTYHCDIVRYPTLLKLYEPWLNNFLNRSQSIIVSSAQLPKSSPWLQKFSQKIRVIPLSIDEKKFSLTNERKVLAEEIKRKYGPTIVLFVGRLVPYKGLSFLLEAMKQVSAHLLVVGTGPELSKLESHTRSLGVQNKVTFVGNVSDEDLAAYYYASDVVALPSINSSEAFGMCLVEGLACGKPLVTTNVGTGVETVNRNGITGLSVPPGNSQELAHALKGILGDEVQKMRLSQNALRHFQEFFQLKSIVEHHLDLYQSVLGKSSAWPHVG